MRHLPTFSGPLAGPLLALLTAGATAPALAQGTVSGRVEILDGDTLRMEGVTDDIRLNRIDAPEKGQTCRDSAGGAYLCGPRAAEALAELIGRNGRVTCELEGRDGYDRHLGVCAANGRELNGSMVLQGWALEYTSYSDGRYSGLQERAKADARGLWQGTFVPPWEWRQGARLVSSGEPARPEGCEIKGNISENGRIYHVPGQRFYDRTRIDESAGERWFCSEAEAEAAGWRRAGS